MTSFKRRCAQSVIRLLAAACLFGIGWSALADTLELDERSTVAVWPAVKILVDPDEVFGAGELAKQPERFEVPSGVAGNLGRRDEAVWLRAPFVVPAAPHLHRVLVIDYPPLNEIDLYLLRDGRVLSHQRMGNQLYLNERALPGRSHAATLPDKPGQYEVLIRVETLSSMVLPINIHTSTSHMLYEAKVHTVQGIFLGLALCMLLYSLAHWISLRDQVFLDYALMLIGNVMFSLSYFGLGAEYIWPESPNANMLIAPIGIMISVATGTRFIRTTLAVHKVSRLIDLILKGAGIIATIGIVGTLLGLIDYRPAQTLVTVLGIVGLVVVLPVAAIHTYRGQNGAGYIFLGWSFYSIGAIAVSGILRGLVEPTFWTQHIYPFSIMIEMAAWLAVLGQRVKAIHSHADRTRLESEALRTMAHTDVLTGLPNRRGLNDQLTAALKNASPKTLCAVYLMDLDGFKPVNDTYGHDVGDALLIAVGKRLQSQLRSQDVVARFGGDEFVALIEGLSDEATAHAVGQKLLAACNEPFDIDGQRCEVGMTIGYALAPLDGNAPNELLKRADAAMYAGKQTGRRQVQRGGRNMVSMVG